MIIPRALLLVQMSWVRKMIGRSSDKFLKDLRIGLNNVILTVDRISKAAIPNFQSAMRRWLLVQCASIEVADVFSLVPSGQNAMGAFIRFLFSCPEQRQMQCWTNNRWARCTSGHWMYYSFVVMRTRYLLKTCRHLCDFLQMFKLRSYFIRYGGDVTYGRNSIWLIRNKKFVI